MGLYCVLALSACGADQAPTDDLSGLADAKSDDRAGRILFVGALEYGQPSEPVEYTNPPRYRAFSFDGTAGDTVSVQVTMDPTSYNYDSDHANPIVWIVDAHWDVLARNDGDNFKVETSTTLPADETYYVVFRDQYLDDATFVVQLDRKSGGHPEGSFCTDFTRCDPGLQCTGANGGPGVCARE
jgi:hypothetical protein